MTTTAIRSGLPITGPPQPTTGLTGAWTPVTAPPLVDRDGGLDMDESGSWEER